MAFAAPIEALFNRPFPHSSFGAELQGSDEQMKLYLEAEATTIAVPICGACEVSVYLDNQSETGLSVGGDFCERLRRPDVDSLTVEVERLGDAGFVVVGSWPVGAGHWPITFEKCTDSGDALNVLSLGERAIGVGRTDADAVELEASTKYKLTFSLGVNHSDFRIEEDEKHWASVAGAKDKVVVAPASPLWLDPKTQLRVRVILTIRGIGEVSTAYLNIGTTEGGATESTAEYLELLIKSGLTESLVSAEWPFAGIGHSDIVNQPLAGMPPYHADVCEIVQSVVALGVEFRKALAVAAGLYEEGETAHGDETLEEALGRVSVAIDGAATLRSLQPRRMQRIEKAFEARRLEMIELIAEASAQGK